MHSLFAQKKSTAFAAAARWLRVVMVSSLVLAGCADDPSPQDEAGDPIDEPGDETPEPAEVDPLEIASMAGCAIDADCAGGRHCFEGQCAFECDESNACDEGAVCTERGRCAADQIMADGLDSDDALDGLEVVGVPQTVFDVDAGDTEVVFELELDEPAPAAGLRYRIDRTDDPDTAGRVQRTAGGDRRVAFAIPVGQADPSLQDSNVVNLELFTELGNFSLAMVPRHPFSGAYAGTASFDTFGSDGLPISFEVVTQPDDVPLEEADEAWLLLPVGPEHLFSPLRSSDDSVEYVARELKYDDFVQRWVATYEFAFDLTGDGVISAPDAEQVRRSLRFEIEPFGSDAVIGEFSDTWTGLYESRTADGVTRLQDVQFTGNLHLEFYDYAPSHADIEVADHPEADPRLLDAPPLDQCGGEALFEVEPAEGDEGDDCEAIDSPADFEAADPAAQASCAAAVAADALAAETTADQIQAFLDDTAPNPTGQSFEEFMADCAAGTDGTCRPTEQVLCGRQLVAYAYRNQDDDSVMLDELVTHYEEITREAYLGQELGAFGTDSSLRLEWLETTDYPAVIVDAVRDLNEQLLDDWKQKVLEVHLSVLDGQFDASGLSVLSREVTGDVASDTREQILADMTQSWRGAIDALTLASTRWHSLLEADADRADKRDYVSARMFDLYLSAGVLKNLNLSAGAGYLSGQLAGGFSELLRELGKLAMPFDELIYARDAEVVINTSVDPSSGNETLLSEREADATEEIERAHQAVTDVLEQAQAEALDSEQLRNKMANEINDLRDDLVAMCGMPAGCRAQDFRDDPDCQVRVEAGQCGFLLDKETGDVASFGGGDQSVSQAGRTLLDIAEAAQNVGIAQEELRALIQRTDLQHAELEAFSQEIEQWNQMRLDGVDELEENLNERASIRNDTVKTVLDNFAQRASNRRDNIADSREMFSEWNQMRVGNATKEIGMLTAANAARESAEQLRNGADTIQDFAEAAAEGMPKAVGTTNDVSAPARLSVLLSSAGAVAGMRAGAMVADSAGAALEISRESFALMQEAEMARLEDADELDDMIGADELETLKEEAKEAEMMSEAELARLEEIIELSEAYREAELSYRRDMDEFRQRRLDLRQKLTGIAGLDLRVQQAKLQYDQSVARYLEVVQRAKLQNAKLQDLLLQRDNVNNLVGSPAVIFGRANRLSQAELRLQRAKDKLMDWLVALEYYAVRPFMDQRMAILLARNTYQLEEIAEDLERLERNCGGATNDVSSVLSVREDLLGLTRASVDPVTEETLTAEERFREILQRGYVPVDKRVRYSTDDSVGSLMSRDPDILSATFFVDLSDFANLELTCNAKISSLAVNLVGDIGEGLPTVSVLYDGTSQLRSCQPGIDDYVELFGPDTTNYGSITHLRTDGRSMSPVAGINDFVGESSQASQTLGGLPLASQYTLLINTAVGDNDDLDWDKLEDVELRLTYDYQDVFPSGQCE